MRILHIIGSLNPEDGGTVDLVIKQTGEMIKQGHSVDIVTLDTQSSSFLNCLPGNIHALGPSFLKYRLNFRLIPWLVGIGNKYDAIIVHGLWQFHSFAAWVASRKVKFPYYIYTHGMLAPWFKRTYPLKHLKKLLYWPWAEYRVLRDAKGVLFTAEEERLLAHKSFAQYKANEIVVGYGSAQPTDDPDGSKKVFLDNFPQLKGKRVILFLGRIHPIKGCDMLIRAFAQVKDCDPQLQLVIAGPDQNECVSGLKHLALQLGVADRITWTGMLNGDLKWGAFRSSEVFVLPSHSENFGVVITESLSCGLPVLTTNKVNIWHEIEQDEAGLIGNDDFDGITCLLRRWLSMNAVAKKQMSECARNSFVKRYEISRVVKDLINTIQ